MILLDSFFFVFIFVRIIYSINITQDYNNTNANECLEGYWGENCDKNCDHNCDYTLGNCDEFGGCKCKSGYYPNSEENPTQCNECPNQCKDKLCDNSGCKSCENRRGYGQWCDKTCENCAGKEDEFCQREDGKCLFNCTADYHGDYCNFTCPEHCEIDDCIKGEGQCTKCDNGYYPPLCLKCPNECAECESFEKCTKCNNITHYGNTCSEICSENCKNISATDPPCNESGYCYECIEGYYMNESGKCEKCSVDCKNGCTVERCNECNENKYGNFCNYDCPLHCNKKENERTCLRDEGDCNYGCEENFEGAKCNDCINSKYGDNCDYDCPEACNNDSIPICNRTTGNCTSCINGFYGEKCTEQCGHCFNNQCDQISGKCIEQKCTKAYYGEECNNTCSEKCNYDNDENCDFSTGKCNGCVNNTWGDTCKNNCGKCKDNKSCEQNTGKCEQCENGYRGEKCDEQCPEHCNTSITNCEDNGTCYKCEESFYGDYCNNSCSSCSFENGNCEHSDGKCQSCPKKFWGDYCNNTCGNCIDEYCDQKDGYCSKCLNGYHGNQCDKKCPDNCNTTKENCNKDNGVCQICNNGYYNDDCSKNCSSNCELSARNCNITTGICYECIKNYWGNYCNMKCPEHCNVEVANCDKGNGNCHFCNEKYYKSDCSGNCEGCKYNCSYKEGSCFKHQCEDSYYSPNGTCSLQCDSKCSDKKCDMFTGMCNSCANDTKDNRKFGISCEYECSTDCDSNDRIECCYAKAKKFNKNTTILTLDDEEDFMSIRSTLFSSLEEESLPYHKISFKLGKTDLIALIDFESNSPLTIFTKQTKIIGTDDTTFSSDYTINKSNEDIEETITTANFTGVEISSANYIKDTIHFTSKNNKLISFEIKCLVALNGKINKKFQENNVNAIIGLGLGSLFIEDLLAESQITLDILTKLGYNNSSSNNKGQLLFGDFSDEMKKDYKSSTILYPNDYIKFNNHNPITVKMQGFTHTIRKAYKEEVNITISFHSETTIFFRDELRSFFQKIYFGSAMNEGKCHVKEDSDEILYYCDESLDINNYQFGIIINNYTYYIPKQLLFKKSKKMNYFLIRLKKTQSETLITIGKDMLDKFDILFNKRDNSFSFAGDTKQLVVDFSNKTDWDSSITNDILSPGEITLLSVFGVVCLIIFIYFCRFCSKGKRRIFENEDELYPLEKY